MQRWWGRSVAAVSSVMVLAGLVAAGATAVTADRAQDVVERTALDASRSGPDPSQAPPAQDPSTAGISAAATSAGPAPGSTAPAAPRGSLDGRPRDGDPTTAATLAVPVGWRSVATQDVLPVPPGRFDTVLALGDRAVVMIGTLDPARVRDAAGLGPEARRLVAAFADGTAPDADRIATLDDTADRSDGRDAFTSLRRTEGGGGPGEGALVRVTTVAGTGPGGLVALAVVLPGASQVADARTADEVVRSLRFDLPAGAPAPTTTAPARRTPPPGPVRTSAPTGP